MKPDNGEIENLETEETKFLPSKSTNSFLNWSKTHRPSPLNSFISYNILLTTLLIYTVYYAAMIQGNYKNMIGVVDYISFNLRTSPIADIVITSSNCPNEYEEKTLAIWPGTNQGCDCGDTLYDKSCRSRKKSFCSDIKAKSAETIKKWYDVKFCIKRYSKFEIIYRYACGSGLKKCGNYLCVPSNENCPLTDISIELSKNDIEGTMLVDFPGDRFLRLYRDEYSQPLVDVMIAFTDLPCIDASASVYRNNSYTLLNSGESSCGKYGTDNESVIIDRLREDELYRYNGFLDRINDLPKYLETINSSKANLVSRHRLSLKSYYECYRTENFEKIDEIGHKLSDTDYTFDIIIYISAFVEFMLLVDYFSMKDKDYKNLHRSLVMENFRRKLLIIAYCAAQLILGILVWLLTQSNIKSLSQTYYQFEEIAQLKCFNNNEVITALDDVSEEILKAIAYIPILSSLLLIVNIFGFGFSYADIVIQNISKLKLLYRRHIHA